MTGWKYSAATAAVCCFCLAGSPAFATNGYFANGQGTVSKGMAGAGVALGDGPLATAQNPALGLQIGNTGGGDVIFFMPDRETEIGPGVPLAPGTYESENPLFLIGSAGFNWVVRDDTAVGLLFYGNGGMNTEYDPSPLSFGVGSSPLGVDLAQAFLALNVSYRLIDGLTIGVSPVLAVQAFEAEGLQAFGGMSATPGAVTNNGHDYSWGGGLRVGALWEPLPWLSLGAAYQTKMWMTKFDDYRGLFAEGGDFDIPAQVSSGITVRPIPSVAVLLEHQRIFYGDVPAIANSGNIPPLLGSDGGPGFGWKDMDVFRIAVQWQATENLRLRTGFSHATEFTDSDEVLFNVLAPATIENHASVGASWRWTEKLDLHFAYTYAFENDITGNPAFIGGAQPATLRMDQHEVSVGVSYRF